MLLDIQDLHVFYGKVEALKGVSLSIDEGEIVALIGANGSGKTTTLRAVSALLPLRRGRRRAPSAPRPPPPDPGPGRAGWRRRPESHRR